VRYWIDTTENVTKGHLPSTRGKAAVCKAIEKVMHHVEVHRGENASPAAKRKRKRVVAKSAQVGSRMK
jgi:predicted RecB family endonuclease